jgi:excinuclease UvrABC nuclease subunit
MPFPNQTPRAYTKADIELLNPSQYGCYGILRNGTVIYVGKGDIRERMLKHLGGDNPGITRLAPDRWVSEVTTAMDRREKELILEFAPICNQRVG